MLVMLRDVLGTLAAAETLGPVIVVTPMRGGDAGGELRRPRAA